MAPHDANVFDHLAEVEMSLGETERASRAWIRAIEITGNPSDPANAERWLYIAQLQEGDASRQSYTQAISLLQARTRVDPTGGAAAVSSSSSASSSSSSAAAAAGAESQTRAQLCTAFCALAELYLTDLCFEDDAERACQEALDEAMKHNSTDSHEPIQGMASLRLSQGNHAEASQLMQTAVLRIQHANPPIDSEMRLASARLLLECAPYAADAADSALSLLSGIMREDDENVEIWFLMGVAFYQQSPPDLELAKEYLEKARTMLDALRTAMLGEEFPYEDQVLLVNEQLQLVEKGIMEGPPADAMEQEGEEEGAFVMDEH